MFALFLWAIYKCQWINYYWSKCLRLNSNLISLTKVFLSINTQYFDANAIDFHIHTLLAKTNLQTMKTLIWTDLSNICMIWMLFDVGFITFIMWNYANMYNDVGALFANDIHWSSTKMRKFSFCTSTIRSMKCFESYFNFDSLHRLKGVYTFVPEEIYVTVDRLRLCMYQSLLSQIITHMRSKSIKWADALSTSSEKFTWWFIVL